MRYRFLVLDTPEKLLAPLIKALQKHLPKTCQIHSVQSLAQAGEQLAGGLPWHLFLVDYLNGDGRYDGHEVVKKIRRDHPDIPIIAMAEKADVHVTSDAIRAGANDFMVRSGQLSRRLSTLIDKISPYIELLRRNRLLEEQNRLLREDISTRYKIVFQSPQMQALLARIKRVAAIPRPVLILGERGTGKELIAHAIHEAGGDGKRPMITINCAAFTESLLESELFGFEKGSFTGASARRFGKFELASGGTLFLDEIGHMSLPFQQKILRVVEYGTFSRVGGNDEVSVNTRIIAATNANLRKKMEAGEFLRDLYDRLSFEELRVPPLRDRRGDIAILSQYFLEQFMKEIPSLSGKSLSLRAIRVLEEYPFPGNVRELKNIIERAAYRDTTNEITPEDLGLTDKISVTAVIGNFHEQVEAFKSRLVREALQQASGNKAQAARDLGISYHQFRYFLNRYGQS